MIFEKDYKKKSKLKEILQYIAWGAVLLLVCGQDYWEKWL